VLTVGGMNDAVLLDVRLAADADAAALVSGGIALPSFEQMTTWGVSVAHRFGHVPSPEIVALYSERLGEAIQEFRAHAPRGLGGGTGAKPRPAALPSLPSRPRRRSVHHEGRAWDREASFEEDGLVVHVLADDVATGTLKDVDARSSSTMRLWEGRIDVSQGGARVFSATWRGHGESVDLVDCLEDAETIGDDSLTALLVSLPSRLGGDPDDVFGVEIVEHEDLLRSLPPEARL
jgi:hypothetical protein